MPPLQLHWNMIRLEGAEVLCNSLRTNSVLTNLDLSYNALGSAAAGVLGDALIENKVSVYLCIYGVYVPYVCCGRGWGVLRKLLIKHVVFSNIRG